MATWAILKKTELTWELAVLTRANPPLSSLAHSRKTLYLWALVLTVLALVSGIVFATRAVIREARFARLKTDFVSSVSHDLRTPLTSIRMFTETLLMGRVASKEEEREALEVIAQETERLTRLTERILDFSRMEAGRKAYTFDVVDTASVVDQALAACRPLIDQHGFTIKRELEPGVPALRADRDAIVEALINLLTNAIKYSPEAREVTIRAHRQGEQVALSVADRGIGIPAAEQQKIFEKFYRVDCRRTTEVGGSGIGLSLVEHIIHAHGGHIKVDSTPGRGSIFTLELPMARTTATA